jgi:hypothetical protein
MMHGNLNSELEELQGQKGTLHDILLNDFEFYMLLPWADLNIPFLSKQMRNMGKRICLKRRQTVQGVGKSFTVHLEGGTRVRLSEKILCYEAVAAVVHLKKYRDFSNVGFSKILKSQITWSKLCNISLVCWKAFSVKLVISFLLN